MRHLETSDDDWTLQFPVGQAADDPSALRRVRALRREQSLKPTMVGVHVRPGQKAAAKRLADELGISLSDVLRVALRVAEESGMPKIRHVISCQIARQREETTYLGVWLSAPELERLDRLVDLGIAKSRAHNLSETIVDATTRSAVLRHVIAAMQEHEREALTPEGRAR